MCYLGCARSLAPNRTVIRVAPTITADPPFLAFGSPEREHQLEDVAGERRRGDGDFCGPRPAAGVRPSGRRPGEEAHQEVALFAIDDAPQGHARVDLPETRRRAALFVGPSPPPPPPTDAKPSKKRAKSEDGSEKKKKKKKKKRASAADPDADTQL